MSIVNPILVEATRSGLVERVHRGVVAVVDRDGRELLTLGDPQQRSYPRSAMKFMQVLPALESGAVEHFGFGAREVALMCGSHNAEPVHVDTARHILACAGVGEDRLRCGTHPLLRAEVQAALTRAGLPLTPIYNNCSGKHAGFLAVCRHRGWPLADYLDLEHPLQQAIRARVCELCGIDAAALTVGVDGCTAPNYGMPVANMARGYAQLAAREARDPAIAAMLAAVTSEPFMVAGSDRYCTLMMRATQGRVAGKVGADGVYCMSVRERGIGVAIKIADGTVGPQYLVAQAVLEALGIFPEGRPEPLQAFYEEPRTNCRGQRVGAVRVSARVREQIASLRA